MTSKIKSIDPIFGMGPAVFRITATNDLRVFVRRDDRGGHVCSSVREVYDGGSRVAGADSDLLEAAREGLGAGERAPQTA
jgi:hypothetical protein